MRGAKPRETKTFELALQSGFEFVARDGPFELRRRVKTVDETCLCEHCGIERAAAPRFVPITLEA